MAAARGRAQILVVDDRPANLVAMRQVLEDLDAEIHEAHSGDEALGEAGCHDFAVVLLDAQMPGMDGFETASRLRRNPATARMPIIFVTAIHHDEAYESQGYELGAVDYLFKPINPRILRSKVKVFLELYRQRQELDRMDELRSSQEQLERSRGDLEQFAYVASHDLQEPLRSVTSFLQLIARRFEGQLGEDGDRWIGYAVGGARRMQALIADLLRFSRAGVAPAPGEPLDAGGVLEEVLENLRSCIEATGASVLAGPLPEVMVHRTELVQILQNLLENAIKYRRDETPRIHIEARREGAHVVFGVRDNGLGIEEGHLERIFQVFQRLQRDDDGGTGIGLAIVKRVVERRGGRVWVESTPGVGSTFWFTLPGRGPGGGGDEKG